MSDHTADYTAKQQELFEADAVRSLLDQLLADSRLYTQRKDYKELLDFVVRLRNAGITADNLLAESTGDAARMILGHLL
jgi:hypothetical protein